MGCRSILVIEDEEIIRENVRALLELEGYSVHVANNGEEGLNALRTMARPCLVLLDLLMPVMNGIEFLEAKSREEDVATIPVCIVSGVAEKPVSSMAQGFLKKPIEFDGLLKSVRDFCGPATTA